MFGNRTVRSPFTEVSEIRSNNAASNRSRIALTRVFSSVKVAAAHSAAFPSATIEATFSVPARRFFSWLPPIIEGLNAQRLLTYSAPTPFGPCSLCADNARELIVVSASRMGIFPTVWMASV